MKAYSKRRKTCGATLALAMALTTLLVVLGAAFFYFVELFSGYKQLVNASDAGALAAAQQIFTVTLTPAQVASLPQEFAGLGIDANGNICPSGKDSNGNPALFNIIAYNNCAAYALEIALNAAAINSPAAISNANTILIAANTFAAQLSQQIQISTNPTNAASNLMTNNPLNNLPSTLLGMNSTTGLTPKNLQLGYYTIPSATSNVSLPTAFNTALYAQQPQATNWINQILSTTPSSNNGPNYLLGGKPLVLNTITNLTGFVDAKGNPLEVALVPSAPNELCHMISTENYFSTTVPNTNATVKTYSLPFNAIALQGTVQSTDNKLSMEVLSAAVANLAPYVANLPKSVAYVAIINAGDYVAAANKAGLTAATLQAEGYANVNLTATTNIAFTASPPDIWDMIGVQGDTNQVPGWVNHMSGLIIFGTDSTTGDYAMSLTGGQSVITIGGSQQTCPATNYNNVLDNPGLKSKTASIPFAFAAPNPSTGDDTPVLKAQQAFQAWIAYNKSTGKDALGHNPNLDPLQSSGGSPALFKANPNSVVPNSLIMATSTAGQLMTIGDALKLVDFIVLEDSGTTVFNGKQPQWLNNLMPIIASNNGWSYLPTAVGEYRPNGFTYIEYLKAQITCLHAGLDLSQIPCVMPTNIWGRSPICVPGSNVTSGLRYYQPYDTSGNRAHYEWPEPAGCPKFETPGTPLQLIENLNIMNNGGKFNANDPSYPGLLGKVLFVLQAMNPNITMNDITTVLNSPTFDTGQTTIDLGQQLYLIYDPTNSKNDGLEMVTNLPAGTTYQPADSTTPSYEYWATYNLCNETSSTGPGGAGAPNGYQDDDTTSIGDRSLIDTAQAPNSTISYNGTNVCPAPRGDSNTYESPFRVVTPITTTDAAEFWPSSGTNNNHGEIHLLEASQASLPLSLGAGTN